MSDASETIGPDMNEEKIPEAGRGIRESAEMMRPEPDEELRHNYKKRTEEDRNKADKRGIPPMKKVARVWQEGQ